MDPIGLVHKRDSLTAWLEAGASLEPGSPPTLYRIRNKESLEDFDHVLDMVGRGLQSIDHTLQGCGLALSSVS